MGTSSSHREFILLQLLLLAGKRNLPLIFQLLYSPKALSYESQTCILMT